MDSVEQQRSGGLRGLGLALLIALPLYAFGTFGHDLWRPAEAREAGIAREMIESGNWVATYLNGHLFLEKPPLYTWAIALPLQWLGYRDWVVRIPVFLFTLGTLVTVYALARRRLGVPGACGAAVSLASMWLFLEVNHGAMTDNGLIFFVGLALLAFYRMVEGVRLLSWAIVFYLALALAFLCKGGIGPALILSPAAGFLLTQRRWALLRSWHPALGLLILGAIVGGWLWALWLKGGEHYYRVFFIDNHCMRFLGREGPTQPWHYYFPLVFAAIFPWVLIAPAGAWAAWRQRRHDGPGARLFWNYMAWWFGAMFVLLSAVGGKDNQYLLPLLPPLAILCGAWVERTWADSPPCPRWCLALMWMFTGVVVLGVAMAPLAPMIARHEILVAPCLWTAGLGAVGIGTLRALWARRWRIAWAGLALLAMGTGCVMGLFLEPALNELKSGKPVCAVIRQTLPPGAGLWGYDLTENTEGMLVFYGFRPQRVVTMEQADRLAKQAEPAVILLSARGLQCDFKDQIEHTGRWQMLRQERIGGRYYWLMGNSALQHPVIHPDPAISAAGGLPEPGQGSPGVNPQP